MTRLVAAELLKLRTTRAWLGYVPGVALVCGFAAGAQVGSAPDVEVGTVQLSRDVLDSALFANFVSFLVAITAVTAEWRHGTITRTFLVVPRRSRVLLAKVGAGVVLAAVLAALAIAVVLLVASVWTSVEGASFGIDSSVLGRVGRTLLGAVLWGALGVAVGALIQSQTPALVISLLWFFIGEGLIGALLGLVDLDRAGDFLPGRALGSLEGSEDVLSPFAGAAVGAAWIAVLGVLGGIRMARRDVT